MCFFAGIISVAILASNVIYFELLWSSNRSTYTINLGGGQQELASKLGTQGVKSKSLKLNTMHENAKEARKTFRLKTTLITKTTCPQHYFLLILVSSAPANVQRRKDIRRTWAGDTAIIPRWKTVFLVAQSRVQSETDSLLRENKNYGDLIRGDYYDHYWNQTLKIQMGFEWAIRYCNFSFLLKMDDDTFVHTKKLIEVLNGHYRSQQKVYMGRCWLKPLVKRSHNNKWHISFQEYNKTTYPNFCPGFGFVLTPDSVELFVGLFDVVPFFRFDDVYVGMLAERAGVKTAGFHPGFKQHPSPPSIACNLDPKVIVWHGITGKCLFKLFEDIF